jgi:hypothetical protein
MTEKIIERILREADNPDLLETLTQRLSLSDLQSLLLEVYRRRTAELTPSHLLRQYEQNRFVQPATIGPQEQLKFDRLAYKLLPMEFEAIELSPVCPLGTNSIVATVDQNNTVTTIRNTEVCSDSTNVMALECACRRQELYKRDSRTTARIKLCASHRLLRAQVFSGPASFPHFRVLALCTAGRDEGGFRFELESLKEQIDFYLRLVAESKKVGFAVGQVRAYLTAFDEKRYDLLQAKVLEKLTADHPGVDLEFDQNRQSGRGYYLNAGFQIFVSDVAGEDYLIGDGGFTDWTQQFLSNRKERLLISGFGSERFVYCFG